MCSSDSPGPKDRLVRHAPNGAPAIAHAEQSGLLVAARGPSGWSSAMVATPEELAPGQQVELEIDSAGTPHLATYEVTTQTPLGGTIIYSTTAG